MNDFEQKMKQLQGISLSEAARTRMREELSAYADLHAVQAGSTATAHEAPFGRFSFVKLYMGALAAFVVLLGVGGTAYASDNALPGEVLYPVKVKVSEPIQTALIPSAKGKAAWHAMLAERRLDEASRLAATEGLTEGTQQELAVNFDAQVDASVANADRLQRSGDALGSLDARSDLEARLTAHEQILSVMADHFAMASTSNAASSSVALAHILAAVQTHVAEVTQSRLALESAIAPGLAAKQVATSTASSSVAIAVARPNSSSGHGHFGKISPEARVAVTEEIRTEEVRTILSDHAALLAKFMPVGTTTATSTASTSVQVASTTPETDGSFVDEVQDADIDLDTVNSDLK